MAIRTDICNLGLMGFALESDGEIFVEGVVGDCVGEMCGMLGERSVLGIAGWLAPGAGVTYKAEMGKISCHLK